MSQLTLQQLRAFGIVPDTSLGQHFLIDDNILGVIDRLAELGPTDVAYEPGPGVGVLTRHLAEQVAHVHCVEIDRRLEPALLQTIGDLSNVTVHWGDAVQIRPADLAPAPTALVSNLPYHVAAPIVAETLQHAPLVTHFCVMVQREVGDRFFTAPGSSGFGAVSALIQTFCDRTGVHKVSRSVFAPVPNVDSSLIGFRRVREPEGVDVPQYAKLLKQCFAHRRKTLSNNLVVAGLERAAANAAIEAAAIKPTARPQELTPTQYLALYAHLGGAVG